MQKTLHMSYWPHAVQAFKLEREAVPKRKLSRLKVVSESWDK